MQRIIFLVLFSFLAAEEINFDALENMKNEKTDATVHVTNFDIEKAKKITSQEESKETWLQKKTVKFVEETAEYMRNNPTPQTTISGEITIINRNSAISRDSSISRFKSNGVKELYVSSRGAQGQDLYIIKCYNGRSISGVWRKSSGLWMSVSTSFGHRGQSIDEVARDYCR